MYLTHIVPKIIFSVGLSLETGCPFAVKSISCLVSSLSYSSIELSPDGRYKRMQNDVAALKYAYFGIFIVDSGTNSYLRLRVYQGFLVPCIFQAGEKLGFHCRQVFQNVFTCRHCTSLLKNLKLVARWLGPF